MLASKKQVLENELLPVLFLALRLLFNVSTLLLITNRGHNANRSPCNKIILQCCSLIFPHDIEFVAGHVYADKKC